MVLLVLICLTCISAPLVSWVSRDHQQIFFLGENDYYLKQLAEFVNNSTKSTYDIIHRMKRATPFHETTCCNETVNENFTLPAETNVCFNAFNQVMFPVATFLGQFAVSFLRLRSQLYYMALFIIFFLCCSVLRIVWLKSWI